MTKRWKSLDGQTKRQASKSERREHKLLAELEIHKANATEIVPKDIIGWLNETSDGETK